MSEGDRCPTCGRPREEQRCPTVEEDLAFLEASWNGAKGCGVHVFQQADACLRLRRRGWSAAAIAGTVGVSDETVRNALKFGGDWFTPGCRRLVLEHWDRLRPSKVMPFVRLFSGAELDRLLEATLEEGWDHRQIKALARLRGADPSLTPERLARDWRTRLRGEA